MAPTTPTQPTSGAAPGTNIWISVSDPARAPLGELLNSAIAVFERAGLDVSQLRNLTGWLTSSDGNPQVSSRLGRMTGPQQTAYLAVVQEVAAEYCNPATSPETPPSDVGQRPRRPGLGVVLERAIARFRQEGWPTAQLENLQTWLNTRGNRSVASYLGRLSETERTNYLQDNAAVTARMCGYSQFTVPTITSITLTVDGQTVAADQIRAGQTVTVTLNGNRLPAAADAAIRILDASGRPMTDIVPQNITSVEANGETTSLTFTITVPATATGQFGVSANSTAACSTTGVDATECAQITATQPNAFTLAVAPNTTPANCTDGLDNDRDGRVDADDPDCAAGMAGERTVALPTTCTDQIDNDHDLVIDSADPDCRANGSAAIRGEQPLTGSAYASYLLLDALRMRSAVMAGFSVMGDGLGDQSRMPATETLPNAGLRLQLGNLEQNRPVTLYGRGQDNPLMAAGQNWFQWQGDLRASYLGNYQEGNQTLAGSLGQQLRFRPLGNMYIDAFGGAGALRSFRDVPSRYYFDGTQYSLNAGLGIGTDWGHSWADTRAFAEYRRSWMSYNEGAFATGPFNGDTENWRVGLRLDLNFSQIAANDSNWIPDAWFFGNYSEGRIAVPEVIPGLLSSHSLEGTRLLGGDVGLAWRDMAIAPFVTFGGSGMWQGTGEEIEAWPPLWNVRGTVGVDNPEAGIFTLGWGYTGNTLLYGDRVNQRGPFSLMWTLPWLNRSLSVRGEFSQFGSGDVYTAAGGATVLWNPLQTFLPDPPQPVLNNRGDW